MQFQVPQFIETEDKVIGGVFTLRQFLIIAAGAGVSALLFFIFNFFVWLIFTVLIGMAVVGFAFVKINGRPLAELLLSALGYYWNPRFYLWKAKSMPEVKLPEIKTPARKIHLPSLEVSRDPTLSAPIQIAPRPATPEKHERLTESKAAPQKEEIIPKPAETQKIQPEPTRPEPEKAAALEEKPEIRKPVILSKPVEPKEVITKITSSREALGAGRQVQSLWEKIITTKINLPKRERVSGIFRREGAEAKYEMMRKATGEVERARRVDYR